MSEEQGLFAALSQSLGEFRTAVDGEPGIRVASMGADEGVLPDIVRGAIKGLAEVLVWLHRVAEDVEEHVIMGDAAVAIFEIGGDAILALGEGLDVGPLAGSSGVPASAIEGVNSVLHSAASVLEQVQKLAASVLPSADDIFAIQDELVALLGERNAPPTQQPGALVQLMNQIGID